MPPIDAVVKCRANIKGSLTKIFNYATSQRTVEASQLDIEALKVRLRRTENLLTEFHDVEQSITTLKPDDESHQDEFEDKYYSTVAELNKLIRKANMAVGNMSIELNDTQRDQIRSGNIEVKLPKINIAPFFGSYTEWQSFHDLFASTIHENPNLNPAQKFQYLKGFLRGEAANLLKHLPISDANYIEALNKLKARYDRKQYTVQSFIRSFIEIPTIHSPTSQQIRKLMDTADEVLRGLRSIGPEANARDPWLVFLLVQKLDEQSRDKWANETADLEFPTCQAFIAFLMKRADALDASKSYPRRAVTQMKSVQKTLTSAVVSCAVCHDSYHPLFQCTKFKEWTVEERRNFIKTDNRCFNCLGKSHTVSQCRSKRTCHLCKRNHNSLLHLDSNTKCSSSETQQDNRNQSGSSNITLLNSNTTSPEPQLPSSSCMHSSYNPAMLPTATVRIRDKCGQHQICRVLLDSGSQSSFITEALVQKLGLERKYGRISIQGLANQKLVTTRGIVDIILSPHFKSTFTSEVSAYVVPFITAVKPIQEVDLLKYQSISTLPLSDLSFKSSSKIDLLIGADRFFEILKPEQLKDDQNKTFAHNSHFGWILIGNLKPADEASQCNTVIDNSNLEKNLRRFWECEEVFNSAPLLPKDEICEDLFKDTTTKTSDNYYMVKLPFKIERSPLRESLGIAVKRLHSVERKLARNSKLQKQYVDFMDEYSKLGHMTEVKPPEHPSDYVYLPHHAVLKETSTTTKLRVVFDASSKTTSGFSLNDNLLIGPTLQNLLGDILLRFRIHQIVFTADAEKMYRQIWMHPSDRRYQRIVWRRAPEEDIKHFELNTLRTYGMSSAPYLATRVIKQIAEDNAKLYPQASKILLKDMYIDDLLTGAKDVSEAVKLAQQTSKLIFQSGFNLRKWSSNSPELLSKLNVVESDPFLPKLFFKEPHEVKVLGLQWQPTTDALTYHVVIECAGPNTKRAILSEASRIFDPLGLLAPFIVKIKGFFQGLWLLELGWDDDLPTKVRDQWLKIRDEIADISTVRIPRWLFMNGAEEQLHGFCDSSEIAYAASVYLRTCYKGQFVTTLVAAKTKIAPIRNISLPRLELNGALLLARLIKHIQSIFNMANSQLFCWTDSTIVLDWLSEPPRKWKTYVANRTSEILEVLQRDKWRHIKSKLNPADCATRGLTPAELWNHVLWWSGPEFLKTEPEHWPVFRKPGSTSTLERREKLQRMVTICPEATKPIIEQLITKYSSYDKIINILIIIRNFLVQYLNLKTTSKIRTNCAWREAEAEVLRFTQKQYFKDEIQAVEKGNAVPPKSSLKSLNPFLDNKGLLRVGGRIERAIAPYDTLHPIILPPKSELTSKLILKYHKSNLHCGASLLLSILRRKYWIIHGRYKPLSGLVSLH